MYVLLRKCTYVRMQGAFVLNDAHKQRFFGGDNDIHKLLVGVCAMVCEELPNDGSQEVM